jgi:hypothetical protein
VPIETTEKSVLAVARRAGNELLLVLVNVGGAPATDAALDLGEIVPCGMSVSDAEVLLGDADVMPPAGDPAAWVPVPTLDAYESVVLRLVP